MDERQHVDAALRLPTSEVFAVFVFGVVLFVALSLPPSLPLPTRRMEREGRRGGARAHDIPLAVDRCTCARACTRRSTDSAQSFERRADQCQNESCNHHCNHPQRICDSAEDDSRIFVHLTTLSDVWKVAEVRRYGVIVRHFSRAYATIVDVDTESVRVPVTYLYSSRKKQRQMYDSMADLVFVSFFHNSTTTTIVTIINVHAYRVFERANGLAYSYQRRYNIDIHRSRRSYIQDYASRLCTRS